MPLHSLKIWSVLNLAKNIVRMANSYVRTHTKYIESDFCSNFAQIIYRAALNPLATPVTHFQWWHTAPTYIEQQFCPIHSYQQPFTFRFLHL